MEKKNAEIEANQSDISALKQEIQQMTHMLQTYVTNYIGKRRKEHSKNGRGIERVEPHTGYDLPAYCEKQRRHEFKLATLSF